MTSQDPEVDPQLHRVVEQALADSVGRGLGEFHAHLDGARVGFSQSHARSVVKGYSFVDNEGRWVTASRLDPEFSWTKLQRRLVPAAALGTPLSAGPVLRAVLSGAANGESATVETVRARSSGMSEEESKALREAYEETHRSAEYGPWESVWSLAWLMVGVNPDMVTRPIPQEAGLIAAVLAAQAKPFVRSSTAWTLIGYDLLSRPWRTVFGPIYVDDPAL